MEQSNSDKNLEDADVLKNINVATSRIDLNDSITEINGCLKSINKNRQLIRKRSLFDKPHLDQIANLYATSPDLYEKATHFISALKSFQPIRFDTDILERELAEINPIKPKIEDIAINAVKTIMSSEYQKRELGSAPDSFGVHSNSGYFINSTLQKLNHHLDEDDKWNKEGYKNKAGNGQSK